jgi:glycosyltransferase involved in cell wall biosynthesis
MRLVLHAPNVHQGGGAVLLAGLLDAAPGGMKLSVTVDSRFPLPPLLRSEVSVTRVSSRGADRLLAEWRLRGTVQAGDMVVCFGNLPPLFRLKATTVLFIQNRFVLESAPAGFSRWMKLRLLLEKLWLHSRLRNVDRVIVQTPTMRRLVARYLGVSADIMPFHVPLVRQAGEEPCGSAYDFLYVSSGEAHKNHSTLLEAWSLLAAEGIRPRLALTLCEQRDAALCRRIAAAREEHGVQIINLGIVSLEHLQGIYASSRASFFPSVAESFGLPLIEAAAAKLPILAPEVDYVRDVVDPAQTFDPASALSIARAIKRHLGISEGRVAPVGAATFLRDIVEHNSPVKDSQIIAPTPLNDAVVHASSAQ